MRRRIFIEIPLLQVAPHPRQGIDVLEEQTPRFLVRRTDGEEVSRLQHLQDQPRAPCGAVIPDITRQLAELRRGRSVGDRDVILVVHVCVQRHDADEAIPSSSY